MISYTRKYSNFTKLNHVKKNSRTSVNPINLLTFFFVSTLNEKTHFSAIEFKAAYHIRQSVKKTFQRSSIREKTFFETCEDNMNQFSTFNCTHMVELIYLQLSSSMFSYTKSMVVIFMYVWMYHVHYLVL